MKCLLCGGKELGKYPAALCWFVSRYADIDKKAAVQLFECKKCGFRFHDLRYSEQEMGRLYSSYRGERYFRVRNSCEPWYTRKINESTVQERQYLATQYEIKKALGELPASILDYGGDRGQNIPKEVTDKYVFELSDAEPLDDVVKLSASELWGKLFDCVMTRAVLEHVAEPRSLFARIGEHVKHGGCLLVIVPKELPVICGSYRLFAAWLRRIHNASVYGAMLVELISKVAKFKAGIYPPFTLITQNEHLNYFSEDSLKYLADDKFELIRTGIMKNESGIIAEEFYALFKKVAS